MKQQHCIMTYCPGCIKLISHSIMWALFISPCLNKTMKNPHPHQPLVDYRPQRTDTYIKVQAVGWRLPLFASLWIISYYHGLEEKWLLIAHSLAAQAANLRKGLEFAPCVLHACNKEITLARRRSYFIQCVRGAVEREQKSDAATSSPPN